MLRAIVFAKSLGLLVHHDYYGCPPSEPGFPDVFAAGPAGQVAIEFKSDCETLSIAQQRWATMLKLGGANYHVFTPDDWLCGRVQRELERISISARQPGWRKAA